MVMLPQQLDEARQGGILVVVIPARGERDVAGTGRVAHLAINDARIGHGVDLRTAALQFSATPE